MSERVMTILAGPSRKLPDRRAHEVFEEQARERPDAIGQHPRLILEDLVGPAVGELPARSGKDRHHAFTHVTSPSPGCRPTARRAEHPLPS